MSSIVMWVSITAGAGAGLGLGAYTERKKLDSFAKQSESLVSKFQRRAQANETALWAADASLRYWNGRYFPGKAHEPVGSVLLSDRRLVFDGAPPRWPPGVDKPDYVIPVERIKSAAVTAVPPGVKIQVYKSDGKTTSIHLVRIEQRTRAQRRLVDLLNALGRSNAAPPRRSTIKDERWRGKARAREEVTSKIIEAKNQLADGTIDQEEHDRIISSARDQLEGL